MTEEELDEALTFIWDQIDANDNGEVTKKEASDALRWVEKALKMKVPQDVKDELESAFDDFADEDGVMQADEALAAAEAAWEEHADEIVAGIKENW